jgi:predicted RecB family nuclease
MAGTGGLKGGRGPWLSCRLVWLTGVPGLTIDSPTGFCAMLSVDGVLHLSASDLVGHLNCHYLTKLDLAVARGKLDKPSRWDPVLELLAERGALHEQSYLEHLELSGLSITRVNGIGVDPIAVEQTLDAMRSGVRIIAQGALRVGRWGGRADVLRRIEKPSELGAWSYEVIDTKLARETKGNTVLQLCLYSDLLAEAQKLTPELAYVVTPGSDFKPQKFRYFDFAAYYRRVRHSLEQSVENGAREDLYPEPKPHCEICRWRLRCEARWRQDDHLTLVAGISKSQIGELSRHDVTTVAALAAVPLPLPWKPERGAVQSLERVREQARLQVESRASGRVIYETLPPLPGFGLACLPSQTRLSSEMLKLSGAT